MRPHRPIRYPLAMLTVAVGVTAIPSAARAAADAGTDTTVPVDGASAPPAPAPDPPAPEPEPPTTEPGPPASEPPVTEPPVTEPPATEPPTTEPPTTEPPASEPPVTEPPTTTPEPPTTISAPEPTPPAADPEPEPEPELPAPDVPAEPAPPVRPEDPAPAGPDDSPAPVRGIDGITRRISFPVLGPVRYANDWGACRDGCARRHEGNDLLGVRMQPLLAAVDGTVTRIDRDFSGTAGSVITITGADGWYYNYFHINNDTPGTDDGAAGPEWQVSPGLAVGSRVRAGQVIAYMGDSGNAEGSVAHVHFEIRRPDRTPVNPYHSLVAAQRRESCRTDEAWTDTALAELSPAAVAVIPLGDGGRWVIDRDGRLHAEGPAARIAPVAGIDCDAVEPPRPEPVEEVESFAADPDPSEPPVAEVASAPAAPPEALPEAREWTVQPGESLWRIVQEAYGATDDETTVALVNLVFEHNRDRVTDPSVLNIGTVLRLPPATA